MPRYFFHVQDGEQFADLQGTVLADTEAAKREASRFASALLMDHTERFWDQTEWVMRVTDEGGSQIAELRFCGTASKVGDDA